MRYIENIEQSTGDNIALANIATYINFTNDGVNPVTFNVDGESELSDPITVKQNETFSGYFYAFQNITITNSGSSPIRVKIGK